MNMPDVPAQHDRAKQPSKPGHGFLGWLGRQVGYVSKAIKADVKEPKVIYRNGTVQESPHPADPRVKLRRTVIDEVVVEKKPPKA
jgi:hypothetical protein